MLEVEIHNFQSIRHVELTVDGFASIVGKSNIGKSAIVRALQYALTGAVGTDFVRHGPDCDRRVRGTKKCKCSSLVRFKTQKIEVTWEKGDQVSRYTVCKDGKTEVYEGLERGTPEFLLPDFELAEVGDQKQLVQIPDQFKPIFLLDQSGPTVADVLSDVAQLDSINDAMAMVVKDRKEAVATRKVREKDIGTLKTALTQYDGLDQVNVEAVVQGFEKVTAKKQKLAQADGFINRASTLKTVLTSLQAALAPKLPVLEDVEGPYGRFVKAGEMADKWDVLQGAVGGLETALRPNLPELEPLEAKQDLYRKAARFVDELAAKAPDIRRLTGIDKVQIPADDTLAQLQQTLVRAGQVGDLMDRLAQAKKVLEGWKGIEGLELGEVEGLLRAMERLKVISEFAERCQALTAAMDALTGSLKKAELEEAAALKELEELGSCPTCLQPVGEGHRMHLDGAA